MSISDSSVTRWLSRLEAGDGQAAERLWHLYFDRLVHLAHARLHARHRQRVDAEDVALSAFHSFCRGVENKRFPNLSDRTGLWRLLVSITTHKLMHAVRDQNRLKRGGGFHELGVLGDVLDSFQAVDMLVSREPSPEFAVEVAEQFELLLSSLADEELARLAMLKLEGRTNEEIAELMGRSTRTIERKLNLIRKIWIRNNVNEDE